MANPRPIRIIYSNTIRSRSVKDAYRVGRSVSMINAQAAATRKMLFDFEIHHADIYNEQGLCIWTVTRIRGGGLKLEPSALAIVLEAA